VSEDLTQNLPTPFEERVLAEFAALNVRFTALEDRITSLEDKVDARLRETRPIWEGVQARLTGIESELNNLNRQIRSFDRRHISNAGARREVRG
jgi:chromosome condensin MukBEF ATPase and DNA-binding subunit MukB